MAQLPTAIQRLLDGIRTGDWGGMEAHLTADAVQDGTMPAWRLQYQGPDRIVRAYREERWPGTRRSPRSTSSRLAAPWWSTSKARPTTVDGTERLVFRMANTFRLHDGRIAEHRYYTCGLWDEARVRRIDAEAPKVPARAIA